MLTIRRASLALLFGMLHSVFAGRYLGQGRTQGLGAPTAITQAHRHPLPVIVLVITGSLGILRVFSRIGSRRIAQ